MEGQSSMHHDADEDENESEIGSENISVPPHASWNKYVTHCTHVRAHPLAAEC